MKLGLGVLLSFLFSISVTYANSCSECSEIDRELRKNVTELVQLKKQLDQIHAVARTTKEEEVSKKVRAAGSAFVITSKIETIHNREIFLEKRKKTINCSSCSSKPVLNSQ